MSVHAMTPGALARLEPLVKRIAQAESDGSHDSASMFWELFDDEVSQLSVEDLRAAVKSLLVRQSDSSVSLVSGPSNAFAAQPARPWGCTCEERMADCKCWEDFPGPVAS